MKVALLAIALFSVAFANPVPVGDLQYDGGYVDPDCEEIDALPAGQPEPFLMEAPRSDFEEENCDEEYDTMESEPAYQPFEQHLPVEEYEDCEEEFDSNSEPAFVESALQQVNDYEIEEEDCEEDAVYAEPALINDDQKIASFYETDEECEDEIDEAQMPKAEPIHVEEAGCEDEGVFSEPALPGPGRNSMDMDILNAADHAFMQAPDIIGNQFSNDESYEDCEEDPLFK